MNCPFCAHPEDRVIDSRASNGGDVIRRRRECEACARRFTTYERVEYALPTVVKKDGRREPFTRDKVVRSLEVALKKRSVGAEAIEAVADALERELVDAEAREISSSAIGERVMERLRSLDEVAYVRFASVYRSFRDIDEFARELGRLELDRAEPDAVLTAELTAEPDARPGAGPTAPAATSPDTASPGAGARRAAAPSEGAAS
jgi:transcriptional repressor NrdR